MKLVVTEVDDQVPGIRTLTLADPSGAALPSFTPGSHLVIDCGGIANAYSLIGESVGPSTYSVSVLECPDGAGGSAWVHRCVEVGDTLAVRAPRSAFPPVQRATRHLLIAAGIGVTPMISHARSARRWGRPVQLAYVHREGRGVRLDELRELVGDAEFFTDRASFVARLESLLGNQPFGTHLYVCGPASFMDDVVAVATELGWPPSRIHLERFGIDALDPGQPFEVELTGGGEPFVVEAGESLLEALEARGHVIPNLCRQGVCGECRIPVAAGEILHRDLYLSADDKEAGDSMMCCVSRAAGARLDIALGSAS